MQVGPLIMRAPNGRLGLIPRVRTPRGPVGETGACVLSASASHRHTDTGRCVSLRVGVEPRARTLALGGLFAVFAGCGFTPVAGYRSLSWA